MISFFYFVLYELSADRNYIKLFFARSILYTVIKFSYDQVDLDMTPILRIIRMQKIYLIILLMPMFSMASDCCREVIRQGVAVHIDWQHPEKAGQIQSKYYMQDVAWLAQAWGKKVPSKMVMLHVMITDEGSTKYWHDHMAFKDRHDPNKEIFFPRWLPRIWFERAQNGVVRTPRLFGTLYKIVCPMEPEQDEIVDVIDD